MMIIKYIQAATSYCHALSSLTPQQRTAESEHFRKTVTKMSCNFSVQKKQ